jgi:hypothetical protein
VAESPGGEEEERRVEGVCPGIEAEQVFGVWNGSTLRQAREPCVDGGSQWIATRDPGRGGTLVDWLILESDQDRASEGIETEVGNQPVDTTGFVAHPGWQCKVTIDIGPSTDGAKRVWQYSVLDTEDFALLVEIVSIFQYPLDRFDVPPMRHDPDFRHEREFARLRH